MSRKIIIGVLGVLALFIGIYFLANYIIDNTKFKDLLKVEDKLLIKKLFFPHKLINRQLEIISQLQESQIEKDHKIKKLSYLENINSSIFSELELIFKKNKSDVRIKKFEDIKLSNNKILKSYNLIDGFYSGINQTHPGSGYIDFHQNNLLALSARGILIFTEDIDNKINFKQIENNINKFIGLKQFKKKWFSLKDLLILNDKIFISYTEEIKDNCWNTSIIYGNMNYEYIEFEKLFSNNKCVHYSNNIDGEFNAHQSGGKIINFDNNHILLSVGDYRSRFLAQEKNSINGKIIKIDINNHDFEIISMGHRNPQGLYFDKENNFILETEHGPMGGDEINLIEVDKINKDAELNYGWPMASAGEHYGGIQKKNIKKYKKYPLYKSHSEYNFIEPLISFVPSIGISEITKIEKNKYVVSSLRAKSLYFFELDNEKKIINLESVKLFERIRDLIFKNNKLYLFLESTASIGIISLN